MAPRPDTTPPLPRALPDDRPVALRLRHTERPPVPNGNMGPELTPADVIAAKELGPRLGCWIIRAHTSAVCRRCVVMIGALVARSWKNLRDARWWPPTSRAPRFGATVG